MHENIHIRRSDTLHMWSQKVICFLHTPLRCRVWEYTYNAMHENIQDYIYTGKYIYIYTCMYFLKVLYAFHYKASSYGYPTAWHPCIFVGCHNIDVYFQGATKSYSTTSHCVCVLTTCMRVVCVGCQNVLYVYSHTLHWSGVCRIHMAFWLHMCRVSERLICIFSRPALEWCV